MPCPFTPKVCGQGGARRCTATQTLSSVVSHIRCMKSKMTRLYKKFDSVISNPLIRIKNKTQYVRKNILSMLCIFLIGFLSGNLFGTILKFFQNWVVWDGFIILGLITKIEVISYFSYKSIKVTYAQNKSLAVHQRCKKMHKQAPLALLDKPSGALKGARVTQRKRFSKFCSAKPSFTFSKTLQNKPYKFARVLWSNVNLFKIGIMVGFFVDAFKVGS